MLGASTYYVTLWGSADFWHSVIRHGWAGEGEGKVEAFCYVTLSLVLNSWETLFWVRTIFFLWSVILCPYVKIPIKACNKKWDAIKCSLIKDWIVAFDILKKIINHFASAKLLKLFNHTPNMLTICWCNKMRVLIADTLLLFLCFYWSWFL
jgi:hypothetical protein